MGALDYGGQILSVEDSPVLWYLLNAWRYRLLTTIGTLARVDVECMASEVTKELIHYQFDASY